MSRSIIDVANHAPLRTKVSSIVIAGSPHTVYNCHSCFVKKHGKDVQQTSKQSLLRVMKKRRLQQIDNAELGVLYNDNVRVQRIEAFTTFLNVRELLLIILDVSLDFSTCLCSI